MYSYGMNYYERIDRSVSFIESHLAECFSIEDAADAAYMSVSNFYRMFLSIAGFTVKEYIRRRRIASAAEELRTRPGIRIIDAAVKYGYTSADAFTRTFREEFGMNPSELRNNADALYLKGLRRISIMDEYFELNDGDIVKAYPDIKLLKKLPDMKVACYKYFGPDPENHAFAEMKKWVMQNGIRFNAKNENGESAYRLFGFNNPDPSNPESDETYGYEVCVTIDDGLYGKLNDAPAYGSHEKYPEVMRKTIAGGMFAVVSIKRDEHNDIGTGIMKGWQRFSKWLELSRYMWDQRQYLEEHLGFSDENEHTGGVDLYMPVRSPVFKNISAVQPVPETIKPARVAYYRVTGNDRESVARETWQVMLSFAERQKLDSASSRIFMFGSGFNPNPPFFHEIMITLPEGLTFSDKLVKEKEFPGGTYMTVMTDLKHLFETWGSMENWRKETRTKTGSQQWVEEWFLTGFTFPETGVKVCYPALFREESQTTQRE
jgi:AraC family transcriptional regulator